MTSRDNNRLAMLLTWIDFCNQNSAVTADILQFAINLAAIILEKDAIENFNIIGDTPIEGTTINAKNIRSIMEIKALAASKVVYSFADTDPKDLILREQVRLTIGKLMNMSKIKVLEKSQFIYNTIFDHSADVIPDFGYTVPMLVAFQNANLDYDLVREAVKQAINNRKNAKTQAATKLDKVILTDLPTVDAMAESKIDINPIYVENYKIARQIDDLGTSKSQITGAFRKGAIPVPGIKFTIINKKPITLPAVPKTYEPAYTDIDGNLKIDTKGDGLFDIIAEKPGHPTQIFLDVRVKLGQTINFGIIQFPENPQISDIVNAGISKQTPNMPEGTPIPKLSTKIRILCYVLNVSLEFWFCNPLDNSGSPAGYTTTIVTLAQLFDGTAGLMGYSETNSKLMVRNPSNIAANYTVFVTFD